MCFVASLTSFYIGMATIQLYYKDTIRGLCIGLGRDNIILNLGSNNNNFMQFLYYFTAIFVHFSYLCTFTWLNVLSYDIFAKFT